MIKKNERVILKKVRIEDLVENVGFSLIENKMEFFDHTGVFSDVSFSNAALEASFSVSSINELSSRLLFSVISEVLSIQRSSLADIKKNKKDKGARESYRKTLKK
jgi:hypothetical protein